MKPRFRPQRFMQAVTALGPNDEARGAALGASHRTAQRLREGQLPKSIVIIMRNPQLLKALIKDVKSPAANETEADQQQAA